LDSRAKKDIIGEVVLQTVATQLGKIGHIQIVRSPPGDPGIQGNHDRLVTGLFGATHEAGGKLFIVGSVELKQIRGLTGVRDNIFHPVLRQGRRHHRDTGPCGGLSHLDVSMQVLRAHADNPDRWHKQRAGQLHVKQ